MNTSSDINIENVLISQFFVGFWVMSIVHIFALPSFLERTLDSIISTIYLDLVACIFLFITWFFYKFKIEISTVFIFFCYLVFCGLLGFFQIDNVKTYINFCQNQTLCSNFGFYLLIRSLFIMFLFFCTSEVGKFKFYYSNYDKFTNSPLEHSIIKSMMGIAFLLVCIVVNIFLDAMGTAY